MDQNNFEIIAKHVKHCAKKLGCENAEVFGKKHLYITVCKYNTSGPEIIHDRFIMPILVLIPYDELQLNTNQELTNQLKTTINDKLQQIYNRLGPNAQIEITIKYQNTKKLNWLNAAIKQTLKERLATIHYRPKNTRKPTNRSSEET